MAHKSALNDQERSERNLAILAGYLNGDSTKALSERYGVNNSNINLILRSQGVQKKKTRIEEAKFRDHAILFGHVNGDSVKVLAERHRMSIGNINKILRSQGVKKKEDRKERNRRIIQLDQEGKSRKEIGEVVGVNIQHVKNTLRRNGYRWVPEEISCPICGIVFEKKRYNQIYCSNECQAENKRREILRNPVHISKKCERCGKIYRVLKSHSMQRFCNHSCANYFRFRELEYRNKLILEYREYDNKTFGRIGEIFGLSASGARRAYRKQRLIVNLERAEMGITGGN